MKLTTMIKLQVTEEERRKLLMTMERFNAACNYIARAAYINRTANKFALQRLVYYEVRERFQISAQMAVRAISKVTDAYKRDKRIMPTFRPRGAMVYDQRILSRKGTDRVSLLTLDGRVIVPFLWGKPQTALLARPWAQSDLLYRNGALYLSISVETPESTPSNPDTFLGVDLGIVHIATTSDGESFAGRHIQNVRARFSRLRAKLQSKGTKSSKRLLKKRSGRERRFQKDVNHCIAKALVTQAKDTQRGIALEDLKHIRSRVTVRKGQRRVIHSWAFQQLRFFVEYKARLAGVKVVAVDPRNTSRTCPICGCIDKANRTSQSVFSCVSCGHSANADENAARIISVRAGRPVMPPNVSPLDHCVERVGTSSLASAGSS